MDVEMNGEDAVVSTAVPVDFSTFYFDGMNFSEFYLRYYDRVYSIAVGMLQDSAGAEDIAHDVFLQILKNYLSFRGESAISSWVHRITVNQVLMKWRKKQNRVEKYNDAETLRQISDLEQSRTQQQSSEQQKIDHMHLLDAIAKLPPGYKAVFCLHDIRGEEHGSISRLLGIRPGTSKSQLHKARMRLRYLLQQRNQPPVDIPVAAPG